MHNFLHSLVLAALLPSLLPTVAQAAKPPGVVLTWGASDNGPEALSNVISFDVGGGHTLALKADGTVAAWGYDFSGQTDVPVDLTGVIAVAAGDSHSVALKDDGTVVAWGGNLSGQATVPPGLENVIAIAAGSAHTVALKGDGTVVVWGNNSEGQRNVPVGLTDVIAITAGSEHTVALKNNGTVVAWGYNSHGESNVPSGLTGVTALAAGNYFTLVRKDDGTVVTWGYSGPETNVPSGLTDVVAIAGGEYHAAALKGNGTVVTWGRNYSGPINVPPYVNGASAISAGGDRTAVLVPFWAGPDNQVAPSTGADMEFSVTASADWSWTLSEGVDWLGIAETVDQNGNQTFSYSVAANTEPSSRKATIILTQGSVTRTHTIFQRGETEAARPGSVVAWGSNESGQTNGPLGDNFIAVAAGKMHSVALKADGTVIAWGDNSSGQTDVPAGLNGVIAIAAGANHNLALKADGTVVGWGNNDYGQTRLPALSGIIGIAAGDGQTAVLKANGTVRVWGDNYFTPLNVPAGLTDVTAIASGYGHTVALKANGAVVVWGMSSQTNVPGEANGAIAIAAGSGHTMALKGDGTVVAWGTPPASTVPASLSGVTAIAASWTHSLALKSNGTVVAWGDNSSGENNVPAGLRGVTAIAAGYSHSVALVYNPVRTASRVLSAAGGVFEFSVATSSPWSWTLSSGAAWVTSAEPVNQNGTQAFNYTVAANNSAAPRKATLTVTDSSGSWTHTIFQWGDRARALAGTVAAWGKNDDGQTTLPIGLSPVITVAAGDSHTVALQNDGTVVAWGNNSDGQGDVPIDLDEVAAIAAGSFHTLALKSDGTLFAWGNNDNGQSTIPEDLTSVIAIAAGFGHSLALKADGTVVAWGADWEGQSSVPKGLKGVIAIAAGGDLSAALKADGTVVAWGNVTSPPAGLNTVTAIAAGTEHLVALKANRSLVAWGDDSSGQVKGAKSVSGVTAIAAGASHTMALKSTGIVTAWGNNVSGQTIIPAGLLNVTAIAAGGAHTVAVYLQPSLLAWSWDVPASMAATPSKTGSVTIKTSPPTASKLVNGVPSILPGATVTMTAASKAGYLFSHWDGLPSGAQESGNVVTFPMPISAPDITAVFIDNPFLSPPFKALGAKPVFKGLLRPEGVTPAANATAALLDATLTATSGSLSGKVSMDGKITSYTGLMRGDGSVWFKVGAAYQAHVPLLDGQEVGKRLTASWSVTGLQADVNGPGGLSSGLAKPPLYSKTSVIPTDSGLLDANGKQGYFTLALASPPPGSPAEAATYPQGAGYSSLTLTNSGALTLSGVLADGTKITASSFVVTDGESAVLVQLPTPGGKTKYSSWLGVLKFDPAEPDSDVTGVDLQWFRAAAETKLTVAQSYRSGWPAGITLATIGALYDATKTVQDTLGLGAVIPGGNADLDFADGKLAGPVEISLNINANKVEKLNALDKSFTLSVTPKTGLFKGTFTPNWANPGTKLPAFQGILLQKGASKGGSGYFLSNQPSSLLNPESGAVQIH